ncbi:MAG: DNA polymerase I [Chlorobi bacterium]|nr:DNA polymerase I [Chlorobiota bacterium]
MIPEAKKLFLLDAYALIYRAYFAFIKNPRFNSKGLNTSAIFGFTNSLIEILHKEKPSHICVVFDSKEPTFRHKMYSKYKANREAMPEDLRISIPHIKQVIEYFNITQIAKPGFEADDIIGTIAFLAEKEGFETFMMTPDKDYAQLVTPNIKMYKPKRSGNEAEIWGVKEVNEKFEINDPKQVVDILALWGDSSDNIPGAPGIGEKTAKKIIGSYGTIEGMYQHLDALKPKQRENAISFKDQIELSRKLATIVTSVPLDIELNDLIVKEPNYNLLEEKFGELEFRNILARITKGADIQNNNPRQYSLFDNIDTNSDLISNSKFATIATTKHNYILADDNDKINQLISLLSKQNSFCFDTETTGLNIYEDKLIGISFSIKEHEAWYVPISLDTKKSKIILDKFKPLFTNPHILKIGQNLKFDISMLRSHGIQVTGKYFDTMIAHYLLEPDQKHNLNFLSEKYLNYSPVSIESLIGEKRNGQLNMKDIAIEKVKEYAGEDADITLQLKNIFEKQLEDHNLLPLFTNVEMPLINVLCEMEYSGISINDTSLNQFADELRQEIIQLEKKIHTLAGMEFNISSPKQLGEVLFSHLKIIDNAKRTKSKQFSTSEDVLARLVNKHEIIPLILEFRSLRKLLNTYVESLPKLINARTGKIHTSYNQTVAATGRLSSTNPNLQNIPIREAKGRKIRKAFIPSDSKHILISADYSQIELRLMAHISNDTNMIQAFLSNSDIHKATAAKIYNIPLSEVSSEQRRNAKTANFGIIYGISAFGLSQRLDISRTDAKKLIDNYFYQFPEIKTYMNNTIAFARANGFVKTLLGRRRYIRDINSQNAVIRGMAERNAINAPIQGSAADIIKIAMIRIADQLHNNSYKSKMILQVHDELVFDTHISEKESIETIIKAEMENALILNVPLIIEIGSGNNWLEAH